MGRGNSREGGGDLLELLLPLSGACADTREEPLDASAREHHALPRDLLNVRRLPPAPPLVLSGHAASLTPY